MALPALNCSASHAEGNSASACSVETDPFKELMVVDPSVIDDARGRNATAGKWSFRHAVEAMSPQSVAPGRFVMDWLRVWIDQTDFRGNPIDREARGPEMNRLVLCPWLKRTPANACDDTCTQCSGRELDLSLAPFRLLAIVNRMDLRDDVDATSRAGESRLVFAITDGPADDPASQPMPFTVAFEYALPDTRTMKEWAGAWHALAGHATFDDGYKAELEKLTEGFIGAGAAPGRANGNAISQVRTNESALNWIWQLREFRLLDGGSRLGLGSTRNTPLETLNDSALLATWVSENAAAVKANRYAIPESLLGGSSNAFMFRWSVPNVDEATRTAFASQTCNGCHTGDGTTTGRLKDTAFHISPFASGTAKLSTFLWDPAHPGNDELSTRIKRHEAALCGE